MDSGWVAETLVYLGIFFGPCVAGFAVVSVWCLTRYRLTRARHQEILRELHARRATAAAADAAASQS